MSTSQVPVSASLAKSEPLADLLDRAVGEMRDLTNVVNDLEALIGNLVIAGAFGSSNSIYDLQKLDRLRQNIGGIADFLEGIGQAATPEWIVDTAKASERVKLADLSERLSGGIAGSASTDCDDAGLFELFDADELSKVA